LSEKGKSTNRQPDNGHLSQRGLVLSHVVGYMLAALAQQEGQLGKRYVHTYIYKRAYPLSSRDPFVTGKRSKMELLDPNRNMYGEGTYLLRHVHNDLLTSKLNRNSSLMQTSLLS
jgi:hypothetical protein